ncbi:MAG: flagellar filament capping protein FliD [bacterium]|nr:flagellar filament capping protein FliD [bacterium]
MAGEISPNMMQGLGSGLDVKNIIEKLVEVEKKKIEPIQGRATEKTVELEAWKQVKALIEQVKDKSEVLSKKSMWEGKLVDSSDPEIVAASATSGAKPGKHTLVVDKLALNHQIASQGFAEKDAQIGKGKVTLTVGENASESFVVDDTNNTVQGFADAINALDAEVEANIIKTGNKEAPYQIVLTSKMTGKDGEIFTQVELQGEEGIPSPTFDPYYNQPSKWKGIAAAGDKADSKATGTGASTAIPELIGTYTGTEPLDLKFTVVNTGAVGVSETLRVRWEDNQGRHGYLDLGSFNYTPGEPVEVVDGIQLVMTDGEVIVNDSFEAKAKPQEPEIYWWKSDEERAPAIQQPASWGKQATEGGPIVTGQYDGAEDDRFTMKVVGSGQIGQGDLKIEVTSENGFSGTIFVGDGYQPGTKMSLGRGLEIELKPGLLNEGSYATFECQSESTANYWWLPESDQVEGGQIKNLSSWIGPEVEDDAASTGFGGGAKASTAPKGPRVSNVEKQIVGNFEGYESKVYTFTALGSGTIGTTKGLEMKWEDNEGNSGVLKVGGDHYQAGAALAFDSGLSLQLGEGSIFETDSFTFRTFSPVIQPPQDAEVRLGATELGGGLLITSATNELDDVIDGVKLNLLATSEKPVTISIKGDTEKAIAGVKEFVDSYNEMLTFFREVIKYDKDKDEAAPLQGDRNLPRIQQEMSRIFINPVSGLPEDANLLMAIGLKIGGEGTIIVDEDKLNQAVNDDLSKVANLFRSNGTSENSAISYLSSTEKTKLSGADGFAIDITQAASKGYYSTQTFTQPVVVDDTNNVIFLKVNGRESEPIELEKKTYDSVEMLAKELQKKILEDKALKRMNIAVTQDQGKITIRSNLTGSRSAIEVRPKEVDNLKPHFLMGGEGAAGKNVQGSINGIEMDGSGQILSGPEGTDFEGLKLFVSLADTQLAEGPEANMVFTKGVGTRVMEYITGLMDAETGALGIYTKNVEEQLKGYEAEVKTLEERVTAKREKLVEKFARLDSKMGQLKAEQSYMSKELAKL